MPIRFNGIAGSVQLELFIQYLGGTQTTEAGFGVDVVAAQGDAEELLKQVVLFVGQMRRGQAGNGLPALLITQAGEFAGDLVDGGLP